MTESAAVPLIVVSASRDPVETINALLRRQGIAAHCTWVGALKDLPDAVEKAAPQLLLCVASDQLGPAEVAEAARASAVPLLAIRAALSEELLLADLVAGARDTINLAQPDRAHRVITRELEAFRVRREYAAAQQAAQKSREQLDSVLTRSNDAIIEVQEGILVEANQAWLDLVGGASSAPVGEPVMDLFHEDSHVALKGALAACMKGQWKDHVLKAVARGGPDGSGRLAVELLLTPGEREGEPCVRIMAPVRAAAAVPAPQTPPAAAPAPAGAGAAETFARTVVIRPPSGSAADISPPAAAAASSATGQTAAPAAPARPASPPAPTPAAAANPPGVPATSGAAAASRSTSSAARAAALDDKTREYDALWVRHIQVALVENRFRLVQQPITDLSGGPPMFDLMIRMLDRSRKEIMPTEFLPAAERNNLMGAIDRWVIGAAARFASESKPGCLFVRLSRQSALDGALTRWLAAQIRALPLEPSQLCLTVPEAVASAHTDAVRDQATAIKALGLRFALERFGIGPDPLGLLQAMPMDFVKIDGSLIQGVNSDSLVQSKVEALVEAARERDVDTIAGNVEDANTMAVLWQLGVQHLEGFLIQAPEEVVLR